MAFGTAVVGEISDESLTQALHLTSDPTRFGVGVRLSISVMSPNFAQVILGALASVPASVAQAVEVSTGDVSTWVGGSEEHLLEYLTAVIGAVAKSRFHSSITVHLSRGCPGGMDCALPQGPGPRHVEPPVGADTGHWGSAEFALYPLGGAHMPAIYRAIEYTKQLGTFRASEHYVTRLEGDVGRVLQSVVGAWVLTGQDVQHVTSHVTLSINSPSHTTTSVKEVR